MQMFNPPHPGETLKELYLEPLELGIKSTAEKDEYDQSSAKRDCEWPT